MREFELRHYGICDASAALPFGAEYFVVANDEDDILRIYNRNRSGPAINEIDISGYFPQDINNEKDLEGASSIGNLTFWITSHGRDNKGRYQKSRFYFFANRMYTEDNKIVHKKVGREYSNLFDDIICAESLKKYKFDDAIKLPAKEEGGFNIEGLSKTPDDKLLIGLRNPIIDGKAVLLAIENPEGIVLNNEKADIALPLLIDLHGLGIRSIEYWDCKKVYIIIGGAFSTDREFKLFAWSGDVKVPPTLLMDITTMISNPESVVIYPDISDKIQLLSDDGSDKRGGKKCKKLKNSDDNKYFRSIWINLENLSLNLDAYY